MTELQRELEPIARASFAGWLRLAKPIPAKLGHEAVLMLDLGPAGALLSGRCSYAAGTEQDLAFADGESRIRLRCLITGVAEHLLGPDTDLLVRFVERSAALEDFIARYEDQIRRAETANADGDSARNVIDGDRSLADLGSAARTYGTYLRYRLNAGAWSREVTATADQPPDGFTIAASETEDQLQLLRLAYEESDDHERRLLREFAAASVTAVRRR